MTDAATDQVDQHLANSVAGAEYLQAIIRGDTATAEHLRARTDRDLLDGVTAIATSCLQAASVLPGTYLTGLIVWLEQARARNAVALPEGEDT